MKPALVCDGRIGRSGHGFDCDCHDRSNASDENGDDCDSDCGCPNDENFGDRGDADGASGIESGFQIETSHEKRNCDPPCRRRAAALSLHPEWCRRVFG